MESGVGGAGRDAGFCEEMGAEEASAFAIAHVRYSRVGRASGCLLLGRGDFYGGEGLD